MTEIGVIVLAFNEVASLKTTIEKLEVELAERSYKIIISTSLNAKPECQNMAQILASKNQSIEVYFQKKPFVAAAVLEAAAKLDSKFIVYMSADLETPPEIIPNMLDKINESNFDIVLASRWIKGGSFTGYGKLKYITSFLAQKICKVFYPNGLTEFTYGFRVYRKEILEKYSYFEIKHPFFLESLLVPLKFNARIYEVPVNWSPRTEGESVVTLKVLLSYLVPIFRTRFMAKKSFLKHKIVK